jgi:phosphoribosylglycinamide formyltransferase 1
LLPIKRAFCLTKTETITPLRVAVLLSGAGSTLGAIIDAKLAIDITLVLSDRANAGGMALAHQAGLATIALPRSQFPNKVSFEAALLAELNLAQPDLVVLAGFMRVLSADFVAHFAGRMINLHPSLLPKFPGLDTHARAIAAGETEHGASIHWVTAELDGGPVIAQVSTPIWPEDTAVGLQARLKPLEQALIVQVLRELAHSR